MNYKKFYGPYEVEAVEAGFHTTPSGSQVVKVTLKEGDGKPFTDVLSLKELELFSTDTAIDLTSLRDMKVNVIVPELIKIVYEYNVKGSEVAHLGQIMVDQLAARFDRADQYLWTGDDSRYVVGYDAMQDRSLLEADKVISTIVKEDGESEGTQN